MGSEDGQGHIFTNEDLRSFRRLSRRIIFCLVFLLAVSQLSFLTSKTGVFGMEHIQTFFVSLIVLGAMVFCARNVWEWIAQNLLGRKHAKE